MVHRPCRNRVSAIAFAIAAILIGSSAGSLSGTCGPFLDTAADSFCPFILEVFFLGITTGTTPTTFDPAANVSRTQMAAFLSRSVDGVLRRGGRRAALNQFWTTQNSTVLGTTTVGFSPISVQSDGEDLWVASPGGAGLVSRIHASDGSIRGTWTINGAAGVLVAMGRIFLAADNSPGKLYRIDPREAPGSFTTIATNLGNTAAGIAFDGGRIFTTNGDNGSLNGSVSIVTPTLSLPWTVTTITAGFSFPAGPLFDGASIWLTDEGPNPGTLLKLSASGAVLQTVTVGTTPGIAGYDGTNIWVPNFGSQTVTVVRASNGAVLATLTGNGLDAPTSAAFDGQRVLITNYTANKVSLFKAADFSALGSFGTGLNSNPYGACSDGVGFWITLAYSTGPIGQLARF